MRVLDALLCTKDLERRRNCHFDPDQTASGKIRSMHLHGILLYVKDLERMRNFYGNLLGVGPSNQDSAATWATFDNGNVQLALHAIPRDIAAQIEIASPVKPRETSPVKLIFEVEDVEDIRARIEALGAQCIRRPWQRPGAACDAIDPEGNIFQICASAQAEL